MFHSASLIEKEEKIGAQRAMFNPFSIKLNGLGLTVGVNLQQVSFYNY
jgi:hypothetical protein